MRLEPYAATSVPSTPSPEVSIAPVATLSPGWVCPEPCKRCIPTNTCAKEVNKNSRMVQPTKCLLLPGMKCAEQSQNAKQIKVKNENGCKYECERQGLAGCQYDAKALVCTLERCGNLIQLRGLEKRTACPKGPRPYNSKSSSVACGPSCQKSSDMFLGSSS